MSGTTLTRARTARPVSTRAAPAARAGLLLGLGLAEGLLATFHFPDLVTGLCALLYGLLTTLVILGGSKAAPGGGAAAPWVRKVTALGSTRAILAAGFVLAVVIAYGVLQAFPSSADEYGYNYLADTLRHGRLWNPPLPRGDHDLLWTFYIPVKLGRRFSQYPPGWPAMLALFPTMRLAALANPLLGLASAGLLAAALRLLRTPRPLALCLMLTAVLAPFTLFNNASFFNHTSMGTCLIAIAALDLREARRPSPWNHLGIGFAFSVLMTIRYEAFAIALVTYAADGLLRRRFGFLRGCLFAVLGALPVVVLFGLYNWRITGSPFETTLSWGSPGMSYGPNGYGIEGRNTPAREAAHTIRYRLEWAEFASCAILPFYAAALWGRLRTRSLRWFDLMLPLIILFFVFYPDGGGFQYGPRYWYAGWVLMPLTVAAWFAGRPFAGIDGQVSDPQRLGVLQLFAYGGFALGFAVFAWIQVSAREAPLRVAREAPHPSIVLFPTQPVRYVPWQVRPLPMASQDYTRNGIDLDQPVLLGRDLGPAQTAALCRRLDGSREVWRVVIDGLMGQARLRRVC